jgi:hypothetical protein
LVMIGGSSLLGWHRLVEAYSDSPIKQPINSSKQIYEPGSGPLLVESWA